jgi:cyclic pyranopterin phosphate synthase
MYDSFGRALDYLRVSITDRCPARCVYCMPKSGVTWIPHGEILSFEEILRIAGIMMERGIDKIRVTGGEPLARRGALSFMSRLRERSAAVKISLTTNGILLGEHLDELRRIGLQSLNISLDTLRRETFRRITGLDELKRVLAHIDAAYDAALALKINCVPLRGYNEDDLAPLARLSRTRNIDVRFIELMPLGIAAEERLLPGDELRALLERALGRLEPCTRGAGEGPAVYYRAEGFTGRIGFINAVTHRFCASCNRLRLSSTGVLRPCLASEDGVDLKAALRGGAEDAALGRLIDSAVSGKPAAHQFSRPANGSAKRRFAGMYKIGG